MLPPKLLFVAAHISPCVTAHYVFSRFMFNNTVSEQWEYVRNITKGYAADSPTTFDQYMPYYDIYDENVRCGRGAAASGPGTKTATVVAGEEVGFVVGRSADEPMQPYIIYHNGPAQAYLSPTSSSPTTPNISLDHYTGDGTWFKIGYLGPQNDTNWLTRGQTGINFTIPSTTPPGSYLLRVEHLYVRPTFNTTQFYIACSQIEVVGRGGGEPGPLVRFPRAYDLRDPGIWVASEMYEWPVSGLLKYIAPGPEVWKG